MSVPIAYATVLLVWSTTPLTIVWSNESFSPMAASALRLGVSLVILLCLRRFISLEPLGLLRHWKAYAAAGLGLFPGLALIYWAATGMSSGLMSVLYGTLPFGVVAMELILYRKSTVSGGQLLSIFIAFVGLIVLMLGREEGAQYSIWALMVCLASVVVVSLSTIWVKAHAGRAGAINILTGSLIYSLPFFTASWLFDGTGFPEVPSVRAVFSILYLGVMGSCVSYIAYFYLLRRISAASVSLAPMITPAAAIALGIVFNGEQFDRQLAIGTSLIMIGIWAYQLIASRRAASSGKTRG